MSWGAANKLMSLIERGIRTTSPSGAVLGESRLGSGEGPLGTSSMTSAADSRPMPKARPSSVIAAAGMTVAMGLFFGFNAGTVVLALAFGERVEPPAAGSVDGDGTTAFGWLSSHAEWWMASYAAIAVAAISCGVGVWLRKRWARRGSQIVMSLCAGMFAVAGALLGGTFRDEFAGFGSFGQVLFGFWWFAAFAVGLGWACATALPVWLLARREAREWFGLRT